MWLINTRTLVLQEFFGDSIPPYAVLSHRWTDDEISFTDFREGRRKDSTGYRKIVDFCEIAVSRAHVEWAWADTACIDKRSSAELTEAINSMFQWYRKAKVCFVHLHDVTGLSWCHTNNLEPSPSHYKIINSRLAKSDWFTRGWTLQELLAPKHVLFFSSDWDLIGSKSGDAWRVYEYGTPYMEVLATHISGITRIPLDVILGNSPVTASSVAEKMSWLSRRTTTRIEDMAYCAIGLFGIHLPLIYGEGERAFHRLQHEIIKVSGDESIFAWTHAEPGSILASSPAAFQPGSRSIMRISGGHGASYTITNNGLKLRLEEFSAFTFAPDQGSKSLETILLPLRCCFRGFDGGPAIFVLVLEEQPCGHYDRVGLNTEDTSELIFLLGLYQESGKRFEADLRRRLENRLEVLPIRKRRKVFVHTSSECDDACDDVDAGRTSNATIIYSRFLEHAKHDHVWRKLLETLEQQGSSARSVVQWTK